MNIEFKCRQGRIKDENYVTSNGVMEKSVEI